MKKSYVQLVKQIATLQAEAEKLRQAEISDVVARIREAIDHYGLTAADLGFAGPAAKKTRVKAAAPAKKGKAKGKAAAAVVKFRDEAGHTWGGRGKRPQWLRDALAGGKKLEDFLVK